jgi:HAD superfamily hydrolase (TIGR01509 family)
MALSAVIFDLDGTLIDTNAAHVDAWEQTFKAHGYQVSRDRIEVEVGKGGDKLVPSIFGQQIDNRDGDKLRKGHTQKFTKIARETRLPVFPGTQELFSAIRNRGLRLALATSSKKSEFQVTLQSAGVDWLNVLDQIATAEDASESKPAPHILQAAIRKLKIAPTECVMIGDTPYDADTARDAGAVSLGVICGKMNDAETLRSAGMRKIYRDPADVAQHLSEALRISSPGSAKLTKPLIESLMKEALTVAADALNHNEVPIGCVIAGGDGQIIARAHNELNRSQNKTAHAEIVAFARIAGKVPTDARDLILVSTLEPCVMCLGASMEAAVDTILFGLRAPHDGGTHRVRPPLSSESQMPRILGDVLADESRRLLQKFLDASPSNPAQANFVRQLLSAT